MPAMKIFVLGSGATGGLLARLLAQGGYPVTCGDRDPGRAASFAGPGIEFVRVNAGRCDSVSRAAAGCDLLVNTVPAVFNQTVLRAALRLNVHYLDMASHLARTPFKPEQFRFHEAFVRQRRLALINAGAAPGLSNLLAAACAARLDSVDTVRIRLFEDLDSDLPVSTWSADVAYDEAVSRPRVYRDGRFHMARHFGEPEVFAFPAPIGRVPVVLAAQDEVATLPRFIPMRNLDVKIGGNEIDRLQKWYRSGSLRPSARRGARRFPDTASPAELDRLLRQGTLHNARFGLCVTVTGARGSRDAAVRSCCIFPSLLQLRRRGWATTPIAFAAAQAAARFVHHFPADLGGVYPPEALPAAVRGSVLKDMRRMGCRLETKITLLRRMDKDASD